MPSSHWVVPNSLVSRGERQPGSPAMRTSLPRTFAKSASTCPSPSLSMPSEQAGAVDGGAVVVVVLAGEVDVVVDGRVLEVVEVEVVGVVVDVLDVGVGGTVDVLDVELMDVEDVLVEDVDEVLDVEEVVVVGRSVVLVDDDVVVVEGVVVVVGLVEEMAPTASMSLPTVAPV